MPDRTEFVLDANAYGLPSREELVSLRIWDMHYHGLSDGDLDLHTRTMYYVERMGIERLFSLDIAGSIRDPLGIKWTKEKKNAIRKFLEQNSDRLVGLIPIDPSQPAASLRKIEEWLVDGPCVGIKYFGGNPGGVTCSHPDNDAIISLAADHDALIYVHTWLQVGGDPRVPDGGNFAGESTPMDLAELASRFPEVSFICGHSGGNWELGVRAVRPQENIFVEFSGSDPHSGQVDFTVAELGIDRLIWGGHGPSRSYSTEISKVLDGELSTAQRRQIFGDNLRRLAGPVFRRKGYSVDPQ